jgi:hypothetical protein
MNLLPSEIVNIILEFQGYHSYRNGKYITKINIHDKKYNAIKRKPIVNRCADNNYLIMFQKMNRTYFITTNIYSKKVHWYMDIYQTDSNNKIISEKNYHYVYEHNDKQHLSVTNFVSLKYF